MPYKDPEKQRLYFHQYDTNRTPAQKAQKQVARKLRSGGRNKDFLQAQLRDLPKHPTKPTLEQLQEWIYDAVCEICGKTKQENGRSLCLDHSHKTDEFRGFLCDDCNKGLGCFKDSIQLLEKAKQHLENPPARNYI